MTARAKPRLVPVEPPPRDEMAVIARRIRHLRVGGKRLRPVRFRERSGQPAAPPTDEARAMATKVSARAMAVTLLT